MNQVTADPLDVRYAVRARGMLAEFNRAGVLGTADVQVAGTLGRLAGERDDRVLLAVALAVRGVRQGAVCIDLGAVRETTAVDVDRSEGGYRQAGADEAGDAADAPDLESLPWPEPAAWYAACRASPVVAVGVTGPADRPVRLIDELLYLDRYWRQEQLVRAEFDARAAAAPAPADPGRMRAVLDRLFPDASSADQRLAVAACLTGWVTVVAGGPGTGKTTTVARLLVALAEVLEPVPRVALAAPTGKAAARLNEAVAEESHALRERGLPAPGAVAAATLHRLLGFRPGTRSRFRYDRTNRLPYDVVIVDETSMVSLTMMSRLLEAVRPDARLVLVGDPDQLASVEAGAVLGDLVHRAPRVAPDARLAPLADLLPPTTADPTTADPTTADPAGEDDIRALLRNDVVRLRRTYRFGGSIARLAADIRAGRPDEVLAVLRDGGADLEFVETDDPALAGQDGLRTDVEDAGRALTRAARAGDVPGALAQLERHRLLCAHRRGPYGVVRWTARIEQWLSGVIDGYGAGGEWYRGRPLLVTANDYELQLYNGDTGVVVDGAGGRPLAAFARGGGTAVFAPSRLSAVATVYAMTVHRAQGSQFDRVSVVLPPGDTPLLTRELIYTAVTRAKVFVRVIGTAEAVAHAVTTPVLRASGLRGSPAR